MSFDEQAGVGRRSSGKRLRNRQEVRLWIRVSLQNREGVPLPMLDATEVYLVPQPAGNVKRLFRPYCREILPRPEPSGFWQSLSVPVVIKTTWEAFQGLLGTKALNGDHWLSMAGLALVVRLVAETEKGLVVARGVRW